MSAASNARRPRLRILVVDDLQANRTIAERLLTGLGHTVRSANGGEEALRLASEERFDLVLMDVLMPGVDGLEATRRIRAAAGPNQRSPIVALTVATDAKVVQDIYAARMDTVITKPISEEKFSEVLSRLGLSSGAKA